MNPNNPMTWPADWQEMYWERVAIMIELGKVGENEARRRAVADTWPRVQADLRRIKPT